MTEQDFTQIKNDIYEEIRASERRKQEAATAVVALESHILDLSGRLRALTEDYVAGVEPSDFIKHGYSGRVRVT